MRKSINYTLIIIFSFLIGLGVLLVRTHYANADSVATSVNVGNTAPTFDVDVAENPASDGTSPTDVGANVTFQATGNDSNSEDYYLAICTTNAVTANNGGAPTCDVATWCVSSATTDETQASCSYTVQASDTSETYAWFAFVCDGNGSDAQCSSSSQGTGSSGSPFNVNHPPTFDTISHDGPANPGEDVIFSTSVATTDSDTDTSADTVKLLVCATAGVTAGACDGTQRCASSFVANNPSCTYAVPTPTADATYDAYVYLIDSHNLESTDANNGSNQSYVVSNVAPVVSNVVVNGGSAIDLTEGTTTAVSVTANVTDNNGCSELSSVDADLYRSGVTAAGCDSYGENDYDDCYYAQSCSEQTCVGAGATYSCSYTVQYHADPTDTDTEFPGTTWLSTVTADDDDAASHSFESAAGVTMNSLTALDVTSAIDYGTVSVGTNSGNLDQTTTTTATGNVGLDQELSGIAMSAATGSAEIAVDKQRYDLTQVLYSAATGLTTAPTEVEIDVPKTIGVGVTQTTPGSDDTWWGIEIPGGTTAGSYTGTNTVTAVKGETAGW